jgi:hypothetical protein
MDPIPGMLQVCAPSARSKTNAILVVVKHQGKKYEVELDPSTNGETFKFQLYSLTGVEPERQKILVKGGQLKDDTDLSKLGVKPGHIFMMMGTPSGTGTGIIEKPKEKIRFLEDMTEAEAAQSAGAIPAGLQNLGNTCYMNATIQTLKSIPELQQELATYSGRSVCVPCASITCADNLSAALRLRIARQRLPRSWAMPVLPPISPQACAIFSSK